MLKAWKAMWRCWKRLLWPNKKRLRKKFLTKVSRTTKLKSKP